MDIVNCLYLTIFIVDLCLRNDYSWHWLILILVKVSSYHLTMSCNTFLAHKQLYIQASRKVMLVVASLNNQVYASARVRIYLSLLSSSSHTVLLWNDTPYIKYHLHCSMAIYHNVALLVFVPHDSLSDTGNKARQDCGMFVSIFLCVTVSACLCTKPFMQAIMAYSKGMIPRDLVTNIGPLL